MLKSIKSLSNFRILEPSEKKLIQAGNSSNSCEEAISLDCTLCLCEGWVPDGCRCVPTNP